MIFEYRVDDKSATAVKTKSIDAIIGYVATNKADITFVMNETATCSAKYVDGRTIITIPSGKYYIDEPIIISSSNVTISCNGALFVGGLKSDRQWSKYNDTLSYIHVYNEVDGLYIGERRCPVSRYPKEGYDKSALSKDKIKSWSNPKGGYLHALHSKFWGGFSYRIEGKTLLGKLKYVGGTQNNRPDGFSRDYVYVENILEEITKPCEWSYSKAENKLYVYLPNEIGDIDLITNENIFKILDANDVRIEDVHIRGTKRTFMKTKEPLLRSDWTIYRGGAIYINNCSDVSIENVHLEDIGSNAIFVDGNNENVHITKCHIEDVGASAVCFVGRSDTVHNPLFRYEDRQHIRDISLDKGVLSNNYPRYSSVEDSIIENVGIVEKQASGVEISMAYAITIKWCSIYNTSRAGINIGDGTFGGHHIDGCDVFDTVKETGDHGSFNSWGRDRFWNLKGVDNSELYQYALLDSIAPTIIENSRFRCDRGWDIDLDDGSSNYEIRNNICLAGGIKLREGFYRNVHHNLMMNNTLHLHVWYPNSHDKVYNNIVMKPYSPILMSNGYGDIFDDNILHMYGQNGILPAKALQEITGMDSHSICVDCEIDKLLRIGNGDIDFPELPKVFGVRDEYLSKIAKEPIISTVMNTEEPQNESVSRVLSMSVKNIDSDDEMSAYGTSSHNGVIVVAVDNNGRADKIGVKKGDVIIDIAGNTINNIEDMRNIDAKMLRRHKVIVIRNQLTTKL